MQEIVSAVLSYFQQLPWLELFAMLLSLAYVILAAKGSLWCWPAAFISTVLYTIVFYDVLLLMDSGLQVYYMLMAVYGYWQWSKKTRTELPDNNVLDIVSYSLNWHLKLCFSLTIIALSLGYIMDNYTSAAFAYLDTFTTVFAVFATYLVTIKVLENWLYWIIIDFASIYLYIEKGLFPTALLFIIFVMIAIYGYITWLKQYKSSVNFSQLVKR